MGYPHHKKLIFKGLQYFLSTRKPEKYNTITPNSGRLKNLQKNTYFLTCLVDSLVFQIKSK